MPLPEFSGKHEEWLSFLDRFDASVHKTTLSSMDKLAYLKSRVTGTAGRLIQNYPTTEAIYEVCRGILVKE